jgi:hypothetical protein
MPRPAGGGLDCGYKGLPFMVGVAGFEPATFCSQSIRVKMVNTIIFNILPDFLRF